MGMSSRGRPSEAQIESLLQGEGLPGARFPVGRDGAGSRIDPAFQSDLRQRLLALHPRAAIVRAVVRAAAGGVHTGPGRVQIRRGRVGRLIAAAVAVVLIAGAVWTFWPASAGVPGYWPPAKPYREQMGLVGPVKTVEGVLTNLTKSTDGTVKEADLPRTTERLTFDQEGRLIGEEYLVEELLEEYCARVVTEFSGPDRPTRVVTYPRDQTKEPWVRRTFTYGADGSRTTTDYDASGESIGSETEVYAPGGSLLERRSLDAEGRPTTTRFVYDEKGREVMSVTKSPGGPVVYRTIRTFDDEAGVEVERFYWGPTRIVSTKTVTTRLPENGQVLTQTWSYGSNGARREDYLQVVEETDAYGNWTVRRRVMVYETPNTPNNWTWSAYVGEVERRTMTYYEDTPGGP